MSSRIVVFDDFRILAKFDIANKEKLLETALSTLANEEEKQLNRFSQGRINTTHNNSQLQRVIEFFTAKAALLEEVDRITCSTNYSAQRTSQDKSQIFSQWTNHTTHIEESDSTSYHEHLMITKDGYVRCD